MAKAVIHPSCLYGVKVTGMSDSMLRKVRSMIGSVVAGNMAGKCLTMVLLTSGQDELDPIFRATYDPVLELVRVCWQR
eukprot:6713112-Karenia_brevis.AAC.1